MEVSEIESPFKPLMAQGDGSPKKRLARNLINFDLDDDLIEFVGEESIEGTGQSLNSMGVVPNGGQSFVPDGNGNWSRWSFRFQDPTQKPVYGTDCETRPSILDLSYLSSRSGSFEGFGGNLGVVDPVDLQREISELKFQVQKLTDECSDLKRQNTAYQDENLQLLVQKDDLDKKLSHRDLAQERIKQLQIELEDARHTITSGEDLNSILRARIQRLEKDFFDLEDRNKDLGGDYDTAVAELTKCYSKIKRKDEKLERLKSASEEIIRGWMEKVEIMENEMTDFHESIEELTRANNTLRKEKFELENNLVDIAGSQLAQFNNNISNCGSSKRPASNATMRLTYNSDKNSSYLRRSLHAEIAATIETITNNDGDKTPENEWNGLDKIRNCHGGTDCENGACIRKRGNRSNKDENMSIGVIPESDREHMIKYAYDPVRRCSELRAGILTGPEWRTLRSDLDKTDKDNYRKRFAQEEGNDIEGSVAIEGQGQRPSNASDLQENAEEYLESFPNLVEQLFIHLDILKKSHQIPTENDLKTISERFNHLALTFQTEHTALTNRKESKLNEHDNAKTKMTDIIASLSENLQKLDEFSKKHELSEDVTQISGTLKYLSGDLDLYSNNLSKTSRRVGMMDVQVRLYKMMEVMVLYVHILKNLCAEKNKDFQTAKKLLEKNNILFPLSSSSVVMSKNDNNDDRVCCDEDYVDEGDSPQRNGQPQILQHLLGQKKSSVGLDHKVKESLLQENNDETNAVIRHLSDAYETLRCELFWPWNWEETWKGTKHGFSVVLMVVGLLIICRSLFPIVSADDPPPVADLASIFSKHGTLDHIKIPPL